MGKLGFCLAFSLMIVSIYGNTLAANAVLKRISSDATSLSHLSQNSPPGNLRAQIIGSLGLTIDEEEELLEALINIYDQTGDPEERAEKFQSKLYEMFPECQNSVGIASVGKRFTASLRTYYDIYIFIDQTLVDGFGIRRFNLNDNNTDR